MIRRRRGSKIVSPREHIVSVCRDWKSKVVEKKTTADSIIYRSPFKNAAGSTPGKIKGA
jgi:hypothetical protein